MSYLCRGGREGGLFQKAVVHQVVHLVATRGDLGRGYGEGPAGAARGEVWRVRAGRTREVRVAVWERGAKTRAARLGDTSQGCEQPESGSLETCLKCVGRCPIHATPVWPLLGTGAVKPGAGLRGLWSSRPCGGPGIALPVSLQEVTRSQRPSL